MMSTSSYSLPRWNHSSRGAPLLRAVPGHAGRRTRADDLSALEESSAIDIEWLEQGAATVPAHHHAVAPRGRHPPPAPPPPPAPGVPLLFLFSPFFNEFRAVHVAVANVRRHDRHDM